MYRKEIVKVALHMYRLAYIHYLRRDQLTRGNVQPRPLEPLLSYSKKRELFGREFSRTKKHRHQQCSTRIHPLSLLLSGLQTERPSNKINNGPGQ